MENSIEIVNVFVSLVVMSFLAFRVFQLIISSDKLNKFIINHYQEQGYSISIISNLEFKERIKYSVPISIFRCYSYFFGVLTGKISYVRKVEIENISKSINIKYVDLQIRKKKIISIKEFDSYEL